MEYFSVPLILVFITTPTQKFQSPPLSPILNSPPNDIMTHLVRVFRAGVNSESSTSCQIRPLKRVTTVYCPSLPFDNQPL